MSAVAAALQQQHSAMSLFPDLEIYGHGSKGGLDPNGSPLQALLQRNQFNAAGSAADSSPPPDVEDRGRCPI